MKKKLSFVLALAMAASVMGGCKGADTAQSASDPSLAAKEEGKESSENEESKNE